MYCEGDKNHTMLPNDARRSSGFTKNFTEYETLKLVRIPSRRISIFNRAFQFGVIVYVVLWVMIKDKGYQLADQAVSGVTAKLKGVAHANTTIAEIGEKVWDAADYVIPPQQKDAVFVMTNLVVTPQQKLGFCPESLMVPTARCNNNADCRMGDIYSAGSGVFSGYCVQSHRDNKTKVCEIYGWCPTEHDIKAKDYLLQSAPNFTMMLKNSIEFPMYKVKRRNIFSWMNKDYLRQCRYNPNDVRDQYCPIFKIDDILEYANADKKDLYNSGGLVLIIIEWNCDLDYSDEYCMPKYSFRQLDDYESEVGKGWNFRFSQHYRYLGVNQRNLIKAYGIQFFITVYGKGGKFDLLTFSMNLGSGLALFGFAKQICDFVVTSFARDREIYRDARTEVCELDLDIAPKTHDLMRKFSRASKKASESRRVSRKPASNLSQILEIYEDGQMDLGKDNNTRINPFFKDVAYIMQDNDFYDNCNSKTTPK